MTLGADDLDLPEVAVVLEIGLVPAVEALLTVAATVTWPEISIKKTGKNELFHYSI